MQAPIPVRSPAARSDYAELKRRVAEAGLFRMRPGYYLAVISSNLALLAVVAALLVHFRHNLWALIGLAAAMGFIYAQLGFMGHSSGHRQMFARGSRNVAVSLVTGNLLMGMSSSWWNDKHNAHHAQPNHMSMDPDIETPIIAYSLEQALGKPAWARPIVRRQALLFFPILSLLAWSMHASSLQFLIHNRPKHRRLELALLLAHSLLYPGLLIWLLGWFAIPVVLIHHAVWGIYIGSAFAPNHKGMVQVDENSDLDFLRRQVLTSRNVQPSIVRDYLYGGLNYQIEHHLFPSIAHCHLPRLRRIVAAYCGELGVPYHEVGMIASYRELLGFLEAVARSLGEIPMPSRSPA